MFQLRKLPLPLPVRVRQLPAVRLMAVYQPTGTADAADTANVVPVSVGQQGNIPATVGQGIRLGAVPSAPEAGVDPDVIVLCPEQEALCVNV